MPRHCWELQGAKHRARAKSLPWLHQAHPSRCRPPRLEIKPTSRSRSSPGYPFYHAIFHKTCHSTSSIPPPILELPEISTGLIAPKIIKLFARPIPSPSQPPQPKVRTHPAETAQRPSHTTKQRQSSNLKYTTQHAQDILLALLPAPPPLRPPRADLGLHVCLHRLHDLVHLDAAPRAGHAVCQGFHPPRDGESGQGGAGGGGGGSIGPFSTGRKRHVEFLGPGSWVQGFKSGWT